MRGSQKIRDKKILEEMERKLDEVEKKLKEEQELRKRICIMKKKMNKNIRKCKVRRELKIHRYRLKAQIH